MSGAPPFRVTHLIPYDGIGGVESAARSMSRQQSADIDFLCHYIHAVPKTRAARLRLYLPWPALRTALTLRAAPPDLVIVSLWRGCIAALLAKLLRPRLRVVLFLHMARDAHPVDWLLTRMIAALACEIWADSEHTGYRRLSRPADRVISFVAQRISPNEGTLAVPRFLYWGRLHPRKNLGRALEIFAAVHRQRPDARFEIIGPDGGERLHLEGRIAELQLTDAVELVGPLEMTEIMARARQATFYLQTSIEEGMAMSVVEAMQLGLVPVVTPAGEIARYCRNDENAILISGDGCSGDREAAAAVLAALEEPERLTQLRREAIAKWEAQELYANDVLDACRCVRDGR